jgi:site-specific recombinase XerD
VRRSDLDWRKWNDELKQRKHEAEGASFEVRRRTKGKGSATAVKQALVGKDGGSFTGYMQEYRDRLEGTEHYWDYRNVGVALKKLKQFAGREDVQFGEVDRALLRRFDSWMEKKLGNSVNTRAKSMTILRRVFRQAIQDGIVAPTDDPFLHLQIKTGKVAKQKLSMEEIDSLRSLDLAGEPALELARDAFLFAFYVAGIRWGDVCTLRLGYVRDGRLHYTMRKTGTSKALKLSQPALAIIENYLGGRTDPEALVFPFLSEDGDYSDPVFLRKQVSSKNVVVNRNLKVLAERIGSAVPISFHLARHSFADHARRSGADLYGISKALGHVKLQTTQTYLAGFDQEAEDRLIDTLFGEPSPGRSN